MSDLISRQAAIDAVRKLYIKEPKINNDYAYDMAIDEADDAIRKLPPAKPIDPVKNGKWIVVKRHEHYPSGKPYEQVQCPFCKRFDNNGDGSFCGYCGAMMERNEE